MKKILPFVSFLWLSLLIILFSFQLIVSGQKILKTYVAFADTPQVTIYDDELQNGFVDWSWGSNRNLQATEQKVNGSTSLSFTPSAWGGLYLHTENQLDSNQYESLQFSVRGTADNQKVSIVLYDANNQMIGSFQPLEQFGGAIENSNWKSYTISLNSLNPSHTPIKGIGFQESTGQNQSTIYFDDIIIKGKATPPSPTQTPTPMMLQPETTTTSTPASVNAGGSTKYILYDDTLSSGIVNWSWSTEVSLEQSSKVYRGSKAMLISPTAPWAGLYLHSKKPIQTADYRYVELAVQGSSANQQFSVVLHDSNYNLTGNPVALDSYGAIPNGLWKLYRIPLRDLTVENKTITGFVLQETSGTAQAPIYVDEVAFTGGESPTPQTTQPTIAAVSKTTPVVQSAENPLAGKTLFYKTNSLAQQTADQWRNAGKTSDADVMMKLAKEPVAVWVGNGDPSQAVQDIAVQAEATQSIPVFVSYNIPGRDCGQYSAGGASADSYKSWIGKFASAVGTRKAVVILEPDALGLNCLQNETTYSLLRSAVETLSAQPGISVYVEASTWVQPDTMAERLKKIGIEKAQGFAINTSGYNTTDSMITYGTTVSSKIGGKHFIIDTSRNGNGPYDQSQPEPWCNPPGRALGNTPTTQTGNSLIDAYLWVKVPGESDGICRGGPSAGTWWPEFALGLAKLAR